MEKILKKLQKRWGTQYNLGSEVSEKKSWLVPERTSSITEPMCPVHPQQSLKIANG
jgi:hypothetical protein